MNAASPLQIKAIQVMTQASAACTYRRTSARTDQYGPRTPRTRYRGPQLIVEPLHMSDMFYPASRAFVLGAAIRREVGLRHCNSSAGMGIMCDSKGSVGPRKGPPKGRPSCVQIIRFAH